MRWMGLLAFCLLLPACASSSDPSATVSREGAYLEAAGIRGMEFFGPSAPLGNETNGKFGGGLRVGYRGDKDMALEVFAEDDRGYKLDSTTNESTRLEFRSFGVAGKVYLGGGAVEPYALLGAGAAAARFSQGTFHLHPAPGTVVPVNSPDADANVGAFLRGGLGCEFHLGERFGAFLEANYNYMLGSLRNYDHLDGVAGIVIRF